jgi:dephospho-CoA kinase
MLVIGLIGRIGAGKSTVAARFAAHGGHVVDADRLAHEVLDEPDARNEIVARFGDGVLDDAGRVRRPALAALVFGDSPAQTAALRDLEAIVHPRVRGRIAAALERLRSAEAADGTARVAVLDVPLLVQAGWAETCDLIVVVECADEVRRGRLAARGLTPDQIAAREAAWQRTYAAHPAPRRKMTAVDASGDPAYTFSQVDRIWDSLQSS